MASREDELLSAAMIGTEKDIAAAAWDEEEGSALDESGDRSIEQMGDGLEGQHEPDDDDADESESEEDEGEEAPEDKADDKVLKTEGDKKPEVEGKPDAEADKQGRVPSGVLRERTKAADERTKTAEAERDALKAEREAERRETAELKAKFDGVLAALQRQQPTVKAPEPAKPETAPDLFEDPEGFIDHLNQGFQSQLQQRDQAMDAFRVETSMKIAHRFHGDAFTKAFDAVQKLNPQNPDDQVTVRRIYASGDPGEALVTWHKRNETLREVGDDPAKFRETVRNETREALMKDPDFRKQLLDELRAEASGVDTGRPNTITRLPKSLNGAPGGNSTRGDDRFDGSEQGIADSAWG